VYHRSDIILLYQYSEDRHFLLEMLDIIDFIADRGGNPQSIKESQRRRYASEEIVDEVIALYEDHRRSKDRF
jgi:seryl-tRNA synthetase